MLNQSMISQKHLQAQKKPYIIFASTVTVFGVTDEPIDESYHDNPSTIYDFHKYTAENS